MLQPKDIDWLNGYKSKACINAIYNRPTSALEDTYRLKGKKNLQPKLLYPAKISLKIEQK